MTLPGLFELVEAWTMTTGTETGTVPREMPALLLTPPEAAPATSAGVDFLADARAEARSWSPNTRRAYVAGWKDFTSWCLENRCAGLPVAPADVGRYLEHLVETEGRRMATARMRLGASAAARRQGGYEDPTTRPLVKATMKRQGVRETQEAGQGSDQRGPGRVEGHCPDPAGRPRQAPTQGDRGSGGQTWRSGPGPPGGDAGRPAPPLRGLGAPVGRPGVPRGRLGPAARPEVQDRPDDGGCCQWRREIGPRLPLPHSRSGYSAPASPANASAPRSSGWAARPPPSTGSVPSPPGASARCSRPPDRRPGPPA